jgi:hypothetical protein
MSFNLVNRVNNLTAQTQNILADLSQKQNIILDIVDTQLPSKQALLIQCNAETGAPVIDTDNNIRHVFSVYPLETSLYFNPLDINDSRNNHIQLTFDNEYNQLVHYYTKTETDDKYALIINVYSKTESDDKYALITNVYNKTDSDIRYYTKTQSDDKYALITNVYNKTDSDIRYYTKTQSDDKYALITNVYR